MNDKLSKRIRREREKDKLQESVKRLKRQTTSDAIGAIRSELRKR